MEEVLKALDQIKAKTSDPEKLRRIERVRALIVLSLDIANAFKDGNLEAIEAAVNNTAKKLKGIYPPVKFERGGIVGANLTDDHFGKIAASHIIGKWVDDDRYKKAIEKLGIDTLGEEE